MVSLGKDHGPLRSPFIPSSLLQDYAQIKLCFKPKAFNYLDKTELFLNSVVKKTDSGTNCLSLLTDSKSILSWPCLPPSGLTFPQAEHSGFWPCYTPVSQLLPLFLSALALTLAPSARNMLSSVFLPTSPSRLILASSPYNSPQICPFGFQAFSGRPTALVSFSTKDFIMLVIIIMLPTSFLGTRTTCHLFMVVTAYPILGIQSTFVERTHA